MRYWKTDKGEIIDIWKTDIDLILESIRQKRIELIRNYFKSKI